MSHSRPKTVVSSHSPPPPPPPLRHRVGDLLWCRETKKRHSLWWPAMVTYDPHQAILNRTTIRGVQQVHVQFFGISAVRGWVSHLQYEPLVDTSSRKLPPVNLGKKLQSEYDVALHEAAEALRMNHKDRKLKFIFNFEPPTTTPISGLRPKQGKKEEATSAADDKKDLKTDDFSTKEKIQLTESLTESNLPRQVEKSEPRRRGRGQGRRRRINSSNNAAPLTENRHQRNDLATSSSFSSYPTRRRVQSLSGSKPLVSTPTDKDLVVSLSVTALGTPTGSTPNLQVRESPTAMDSYVTSMDKVSNLKSCSDSDKPLNGITTGAAPNGVTARSPVKKRGRGRPRKNSTLPNFRLVPRIEEKMPPGGGVEGDGFLGPPPLKRLALEPGSETGSESSGVSIASAILTPPSSGNEAIMEEDPGAGSEIETIEKELEERREGEGGGRGRGRGRGRGKGRRRTKLDRVQVKTEENQNADGPSFRDGHCAICDARDSNLLACTGQCFQVFHVDCLGLVQPPRFQFVCDECQVDTKRCFLCKGLSLGPLESCSKPQCGKFYHPSCIGDDRLFTYDDRRVKFTCPLHVCAKCICNDYGAGYAPRGSSLVQCVKCPLALHAPHCLIAGCNMLSDSEMICYLHVKIEPELNLYKHVNMDTCLDCGESGSLYCCDFCSSAYHRKCMEEHHMPVEEGERRWRIGEGGGGGGGEVVAESSSTEKWICPECRDHDLPIYESIVLCKFGVWRWWPGQVIPMDDVPDNIAKKKPGEGMFVVRFCGTNDYCWIHHGRTISISLDSVEDPVKEVNKMYRRNGKKYAHTDKVYKRACEEAVELYMKHKNEQEKSKPLPKQESKAYTKLKVNRYLVPRPTISDDDLHSLPCQCTPESPCDDDSICVNRAIHVECDPKTCPVGLFCHNQKMRRFQYPNTVPFYTGTRGWGLRSTTDIKKGDFVVEYVGEVLDMDMCRERLRRAHENQTQHFYMLTLDSKNGLVIDAKEKSNHARFINHSCDPNCETQKWTVGHESRVGIFAKEDLKASTELTFDYQLDSLGNEKKECLCGSRNCSGFIGVRSKVEPKPKPKPKMKKKAKPPTQPRPKVPPPNAPPVEVTHENDCFICGDGGDLLCCDFGKCNKVYHLQCIGRKLIPPERWECPRHFCTICSKRAFAFCSSCPISYCGKHRRDKLVKVDDKLKCESCINPSDGGEEEEGEGEEGEGGERNKIDSSPQSTACPTSIASHPVNATSIASHLVDATSIASHPVDATSIASHPVDATSIASHQVNATSIASHQVNAMSIESVTKTPTKTVQPIRMAYLHSPPPPPHPMLPLTPSRTTPVLPAISPTLPPYPHTFPATLPVFTHPLAPHSLRSLSPHPQQPFQLIMPHSNQQPMFIVPPQYFNPPQPFLASPTSSLIYPTNYHH